MICSEEEPILRECPPRMGIDILEKKVFSISRPGTDLARDVIPELMKTKRPCSHTSQGTATRELQSLNVREFVELKSLFRIAI